MISKKTKKEFVRVRMKWKPGSKAVWINHATGKHNGQASWKLKDTAYNGWSAIQLLLAALVTDHFEMTNLVATRSGVTIIRYTGDFIAQVEADKENDRIVDINCYPEIELNNDTPGDEFARSLDLVQPVSLLKKALSVPLIFHTVIRHGNNKNYNNDQCKNDNCYT